MTVAEAAMLSGLAPFTIRMKARNTAFSATKPSNREGWDIHEESFRLWMQKRRRNGANKSMQSLMKAGVAE